MAAIELYGLKKSNTELQLFLSTIQAGFPSPFDEYLEEVLSLDDGYINNPAGKF